MRVGLIVNTVTSDRRRNLSAAIRLADQAAGSGAELIILPEAALTGLINNDDPEHDLPLGETIPGPATDALCEFTHSRGVWLGIGMLERDGATLYDSAVLCDPAGEIRLSYRRNQPQWHGRNADPTVYRQGTEIPTVDTPFGRVGFLICGDLFDDGIVSRFRGAKPNWLLFPFARCFADGSHSQERWDRDELPQYLERVRTAQTPALMTNYIADRSIPGDNSFGGAFCVSAEGDVLGSLPLGE